MEERRLKTEEEASNPYAKCYFCAEEAMVDYETFETKFGSTTAVCQDCKEEIKGVQADHVYCGKRFHTQQLRWSEGFSG